MINKSYSNKICKQTIEKPKQKKFANFRWRDFWRAHAHLISRSNFKKSNSFVMHEQLNLNDSWWTTNKWIRLYCGDFAALVCLYWNCDASRLSHESMMVLRSKMNVFCMRWWFQMNFVCLTWFFDSWMVIRCIIILDSFVRWVIESLLIGWHQSVSRHCHLTAIALDCKILLEFL